MPGPSFSLLLLVILLGSSSAFDIIEKEEEISVREDESLNLACTGREEWDYCKWVFYDKSCGRNIGGSPSTCNIAEDGRILWAGVPSIDGTCRLSIPKPQRQDAGVWTCQLIQSQDTTKVASRSYKVTVFSKAHVTFASRPHMRMAVGEEYAVECKGEGGMPEPDLVALVGPNEMVDENDKALELVTTDSDGLQGGTVTKLFSYKPTKEFIDMFIKCMVYQQDEDGRNVYDPDTISYPFTVVFPPLPKETPLEEFYVDDGEDAIVTISFHAHPPPMNDQVIWHLVHETSNQSKLIPAGAVVANIEALDIEVHENGLNSATLLIHQISYDEISSNYCYLEVSNEIGRFEYNFHLAPKPLATEAPNAGDKGKTRNGGLSVGGIVGISITCLLIVLAIFIGVFFCHKQEKCCFASKEQKEVEMNYMSDEQRDNEASNTLLTQSGPVDEVDQSREVEMRQNGGTNSSANRMESYHMATQKEFSDS